MNKLWYSILFAIVPVIAQADLFGNDTPAVAPNYCDGCKPASGTPGDAAFQSILSNMCQSSCAMQGLLLQNQTNNIGGSGATLNGNSTSLKNLSQLVLGRKSNDTVAVAPISQQPIAATPAPASNAPSQNQAAVQQSRTAAGIFGNA